MSKKTKQNLRLPIFLIIGPALGIIASIILYAVINFIMASVTPDSVDSSGSLFGNSSVFQTLSNSILFLLGSISVLAFLPCLIFGVVILNNRRNLETDEGAAKGRDQRGWKDLE